MTAEFSTAPSLPRRMSAPTLTVEARLARLEQQLTELRQRLDSLERTLATRADHPVDRTAVREKVTFDWQS